MKTKNKTVEARRSRLRHGFVLSLFVAAGVIVGAAAFDLQYFQQTRLMQEGEDRHVRYAQIPASRGSIVDRNGEILALSMPAYAVWADPLLFEPSEEHFRRLAQLVGLPPAMVRAKLGKTRNSRHVYLRRGMEPHIKGQLESSPIPGVFLRHEYRRYYPLGEATAQLLGLIDVDSRGISGVELAFDKHLKGRKGKRRMRYDRSGREIEELGDVNVAQNGRQLKLSIDGYIQYRTWSALKDAVVKHHALAGSAVMLDARTGDILALVNYPGFDPHDRSSIKGELARNKAVINHVEPGSTLKPFIVAMLLENGYATPKEGLQTSPGYYKYKGHEVRDIRDYGYLNVGDILVKSSNVGISKLARRLSPEEMWTALTRLGFNSRPLTGFPGEADGVLRHYSQWGDFGRTALSYGYGMSASLLQIARAYVALARDGMMPEVNLVARSEDVSPQHTRVFSVATARRVRRMLTEVVERGTGRRAKAHGYTTAGKTGTVRKSRAGEYLEDSHISLFAGFAPATRPRIVLAVMLDEPGGEQYLGGVVAAPVFSEVVTATLRKLRVPEDEVGVTPAYRVTRKAT